jgi:hypothetical protein
MLTHACRLHATASATIAAAIGRARARAYRRNLSGRAAPELAGATDDAGILGRATPTPADVSVEMCARYERKTKI